jgi:hypothetical protein
LPLLSLNPGFDPDNLLSMQLSVSGQNRLTRRAEDCTIRRFSRESRGRVWPDEDPIGKRIGNAPGTEWFTTIAVVHNIKQADWQSEPGEEIYFPLLQSEHRLLRDARHYEFLGLVVRVDSGPAAKSASIRHAIETIDPHSVLSPFLTAWRSCRPSIVCPSSCVTCASPVG